MVSVAYSASCCIFFHVRFLSRDKSPHVHLNSRMLTIFRLLCMSEQVFLYSVRLSGLVAVTLLALLRNKTSRHVLMWGSELSVKSLK
jgi:hypothetical protein